MKITYVAASGVLLEHQGTRILCDPWLNGPAYYGSWHHNPKVEFTVRDLGPVDYLYLSHIHQDHTHLPTLKDVRAPDGSKPPVLMAPYVEEYMGTMLRGRGFVTHELQPHQRVKAGNIGVEIVAADLCNSAVCGQHFGCPLPKVAGKSWQIDSLGVFFTENRRQVVVNVNDCPHGLGEGAARYVRYTYGPATAVLVNISLAGAWPQAHDLPTILKIHGVRSKHDDGLHGANQYLDWLQPQYGLPMGDVYTLGGRLAPLNPFRGTVEIEELQGEQLVRLNRLAWLDLETGTVSEPFTPRDYRAMDRYTNEVLSQHPFDYDADPEPTDLEGLLDVAQEAFWQRCEERGGKHGWDITLKWGDGERTVTTHPGAKESHMTITLDPKLLRRLLKRKANWHVAEIGSHLWYHREPDVFEHGVYRAMNYFHV